MMKFGEKRHSSSRPLPLKQRTSSSDTRRDYTAKTWTSLLVLIKLREYFISVDHFSIWRRHLAWAMENGKDLRGYMTQRFASNMVFMGLLLSTELSLLFNSAKVTTNVRMELLSGNHYSISFWAGFMIIVSALLTLLSLISTFTAWAMVNSVDEANTHCIFRSSIGQYAAELPGRFIVCSIYSFLISFVLFFFLLLPVGTWSIALMLATLSLFVHVVATFSAFGRVIMHTGAMGKTRIFDPEYEMSLLPHSLHANLLNKAKANLANNTSITRQYRRKQNPIDRYYSEDELYDYLNDRVPSSLRSAYSNESTPPVADTPVRGRADSTVRFADEEAAPAAVVTEPNQRCLTPISDISYKETPPSSARLANRKSLTTGRLEQPISTIKPTRPPRPSIVKTSNSSSSCNSNPLTPHGPPTTTSVSSLEQWLQASPTVSTPKNSDYNGLSGISQIQCNTEVSSSSLAINSNGYPVTPTNPLPPPPPPKEVTTWQDPKNLQGRRFNQLEGWNERVMTEDEKFALDYGEISDPDESQPIGSSIDNDVGGDLNGWGANGCQEKVETAQLLQNGPHRNNYYASTFSSHQDYQSQRN